MRTMFYQSNAKTFEYARKPRGNTTPAEELLWNHLSKNQPDGYRFKRQHPISNYTADFFCHRAKMIIEVDGEVHQQVRIARERERTLKMEAMGCQIIRFTMYQIEYVISCIIKELYGAFTSRSGEVGGAGKMESKEST